MRRSGVRLPKAAPTRGDAPDKITDLAEELRMTRAYPVDRRTVADALPAPTDGAKAAGGKNFPRRSAQNEQTFTLAEAIDDWHLALRASNLAPRTIDSYVDAAERLARFLGSGAEVQRLTHRDIQRFLVHLAETPHQRTGRPVTASYVAGIYRRLQQLFRWLEEEQEIPSSPFRRLRPPAVPTRPVP